MLTESTEVAANDPELPPILLRKVSTMMWLLLSPGIVANVVGSFGVSMTYASAPDRPPLALSVYAIFAAPAMLLAFLNWKSSGWVISGSGLSLVGVFREQFLPCHEVTHLNVHEFLPRYQVRAASREVFFLASLQNWHYRTESNVNRNRRILAQMHERFTSAKVQELPFPDVHMLDTLGGERSTYRRSWRASSSATNIALAALLAVINSIVLFVR